MDERTDLDAVLTVFARVRITAASESDAQEQIAEALTAAGIPCEREVRLSGRDRVDVLAGPIAIEVKTKAVSSPVLWRQVQRYATHDRIETVIVASTLYRNVAGLPEELAGKPIIPVVIGRVL